MDIDIWLNIFIFERQDISYLIIYLQQNSKSHIFTWRIAKPCVVMQGPLSFDTFLLVKYSQSKSISHCKLQQKFIKSELYKNTIIHLKSCVDVSILLPLKSIIGSFWYQQYACRNRRVKDSFNVHVLYKIENSIVIDLLNW